MPISLANISCSQHFRAVIIKKRRYWSSLPGVVVVLVVVEVHEELGSSIPRELLEALDPSKNQTIINNVSL